MQLNKATFVEPSTGFLFTDNPHYLRIDSIWNHENFWIKIEGHRTEKLPSAQSFDLQNTSMWMAFKSSEGIVQLPFPKSLSPNPNPQSMLLCRFWCKIFSWPSSMYLILFVHNACFAGYVQATSTSSYPFHFLQALLYPCVGIDCNSWVQKVSLDQTLVNMRCPRGSRTKKFKHCLHEKFAKRGESRRWDGLQERHTVFSVSFTVLTLKPLLCLTISLVGKLGFSRLTSF